MDSNSIIDMFWLKKWLFVTISILSYTKAPARMWDLVIWCIFSTYFSQCSTSAFDLIQKKITFLIFSGSIFNNASLSSSFMIRIPFRSVYLWQPRSDQSDWWKIFLQKKPCFYQDSYSMSPLRQFHKIVLTNNRMAVIKVFYKFNQKSSTI